MIRFPDSLEETGTASNPLVGRGLDRVDGPAKVRGTAKYAAEFLEGGVAHGVVVSSAIAKGRIVSIDTAAALAAPGVVQVFTHENRPSLAWFDRKWKDDDAPYGEPFRPLHGAGVVHSLQPVALVVAETFEQARHAAGLVDVRYERVEHATDLRAERGSAREPAKYTGGRKPPPKPRGDADAALAGSAVRVDVEYATPAEHHNPLEMFATTVLRDDDGTLTIHDKTQGVLNSKTYVCNVFGLDDRQVRVMSAFVGGAFGSALRPQHQLFLAVLAATELKRSVQVTLTRQQMFSFGHRPETLQRVALGADADGTLQALIHEAQTETSRFEDYAENVVGWGAMLYRCDNVRLDYKLVPLDIYTPIDMRAPGAAQGVLALECAVDELAHALKMDPVALRLKNYTERDEASDKDWSSKALRECFERGAARFGWSRRSAEPRSMRDGEHLLVGWGMACGIWEAGQMKASAKAVLHASGKLTVSSATSDIGTGTYTAMTQVAAATLGLEPGDVTFRLGDSSLPAAPLEGGSWTVSSVGTAVKAACDRIADKLFDAARGMKDSPLAGVKRDDVVFEAGAVRLRDDASRAVALGAAMRAAGLAVIEETATTLPSVKRLTHTVSTHSAVFVEVAVDDRLGRIEVRRVVSAIAGGRVVNAKTARSQILGGVVWGLGMALQEESLVDDRLGRYMNHNLSEYHVPVHADVPADIDIVFVDEHDEVVNPLGAKGLGEIGIVGVGAAVANAVFHATGRRVRELPITLDKVMAP